MGGWEKSYDGAIMLAITNVGYALAFERFRSVFGPFRIVSDRFRIFLDDFASSEVFELVWLLLFIFYGSGGYFFVRQPFGARINSFS